MTCEEISHFSVSNLRDPIPDYCTKRFQLSSSFYVELLPFDKTHKLPSASISLDLKVEIHKIRLLGSINQSRLLIHKQ